MAEKIRLDVLLADRGLAPSREAARGMITAGEVRVAGEVRDKPGMHVPRETVVEVHQPPRFVSRAARLVARAPEIARESRRSGIARFIYGAPVNTTDTDSSPSKFT
mgnify:CR=1 FL=1